MDGSTAIDPDLLLSDAEKQAKKLAEEFYHVRWQKWCKPAPTVNGRDIRKVMAYLALPGCSPEFLSKLLRGKMAEMAKKGHSAPHHMGYFEECIREELVVMLTGKGKYKTSASASQDALDRQRLKALHQIVSNRGETFRAPFFTDADFAKYQQLKAQYAEEFALICTNGEGGKHA